MSFGRNLQALREQAGLSQSELATKANVSVKSLQNWEIDRNLPRLDAIVKLAQVLAVPMETLAAGIAAPKHLRPRGRPRKAAHLSPPAAEQEATSKKPRNRPRKRK